MSDESGVADEVRGDGAERTAGSSGRTAPGDKAGGAACPTRQAVAVARRGRRERRRRRKPSTATQLPGSPRRFDTKAVSKAAGAKKEPQPKTESRSVNRSHSSTTSSRSLPNAEGNLAEPQTNAYLRRWCWRFWPSWWRWSPVLTGLTKLVMLVFG